MVQESTNNPPLGSPPSEPHEPSLISPGIRCVVLINPGGAAPVDLLGGLSKRGVSTQVVADAAHAMVELARQHTGALVVVNPVQQPGLVDLIEAVKTYHPRTVRWSYRSAHPKGQAQLQPLNGQSVGDAESADHKAMSQPEKSDQVSEVASPSPLGRVQAQVPSDRVRSLIVKVQGPAEVGEPLITEEELAMLLGPVPEELGGES
jgi:hypothetical protein